MIRRALVLAVVVALSSGSTAFAAKAHFKIKDWGNSKVKEKFFQPPAEVLQAPEDRVEKANEAKRSPASDQKSRNRDKKNVGSVDLLSQELKDFEFGKDGPGLFTLKSAGDLQRLFNRYQVSVRDPSPWRKGLKNWKQYELYEADASGKARGSDNWFLADGNVDPDLQFVVNRLAPLAAFRGILWRMAPLTHQSTMTHVMLLNMVRTFAENSMVFFPESQWQVYMAYLGTPDGKMITGGTQKCQINEKTVDISEFQFCYENDLVKFLWSEVKPVLDQSIYRLSKMPLGHKIKGHEEPLYFDNRIRFGGRGWSNQKAEAYDSVDQFAEIGNAERLLAMARFQRRNSVIAQLAGYNWNGNIALRKELGKRIGIGSEIDKLDSDPFSLEGLSREDRVILAGEFSAKGTFNWIGDDNNNLAKMWMPKAYDYMAQYASNSLAAWREMESRFKNSPDDDFLLDPDLFRGRQDQIRRGVENLAAMFPAVTRDRSGRVANPPGPARLYGAISGDVIDVNMFQFFNNPPKSIVNLMPTQWAHHEDIEHLPVPKGLVRVTNPEVSTFIMIDEKHRSDAEKRLNILAQRRAGVRSGKAVGEGLTYLNIKMQQLTQKGASNAPDFEMRNYLWGRAIGWNVGTYSSMFPGVSAPGDVMKRQQTLAEVRGGRVIMNSLAIFIK